MRGLGDGPVQTGIEAFEVVGGASGVEAVGDAVEVGLGGDALVSLVRDGLPGR